MSSQLHKETPDSALRSNRPLVEPVVDSAGGRQRQSSDDTPTIISRTNLQGFPIIEDSSQSLRGRHLAHFELIEPIGVGGMAAVLRARDTQLDRFVALKILPPEMASDPENIRRFHQEARSAAKLDHENIARVFFCGEDQRLHFIAFEFVEGDNLRTLLERRGKLPVREAVHYMLQVAAGLSHAAQRGVVHRDIKPSNIIITPNGRAKLVDMGLARSLERQTDDLTQSGVTLGTFDYISPEQALEPREADVRSDIYSLGCTFYHLLTGQPPVPEGTAARKLHHHQHVKPIDPRELLPELPVEVAQILNKMMAKNPRDRFQSPEELVHQLLQVTRKLGAAAEVPEGVLSVETSVPTGPSGRPLLWTVLATLSVIALVLLLDQLPNDSSPLPQPVASAEKQEGANPVKGANNQISNPAVESPRQTNRSSPTEQPLQYTAPNLPSADLINDLRVWLNDHRDAPSIELRLAGDMELPKEGLLISARQEVIIKPRVEGQPVTLRFSNARQEQRSLVALSIQSPRSYIEGVRFIINAHESDKPMTALQLPAGQHRVSRCEFIQARRDQRVPDAQLASVAIRSDTSRSKLDLDDCVFLGYGDMTGERGSRADVGGQHAVVRKGSVALTVTQCVFGPHQAAFRLENGSADEIAQLSVRQCTLLLPPRRSAAFEFPAGGKGRLELQHSLIARCAGEGDDGAVLIAQADEQSGSVVFQGRDNRYYDLDGYWSIADNWKLAGWSETRKRLGMGNTDEASRVLLSRPWPDQSSEYQSPLDWLEKQQITEAFKLHTGQLALRKTQTTSEFIGATRILGQSWLPASYPTLDERNEIQLPRTLVVEVSEDAHEGDSRNGVYRSLDAAMPNARPGDVILLRHDGELVIHPIALDKKDLNNLTIRPARQFQPILTLPAETTSSEPSLFRIHEGRLRLEGLAFRLAPAKGSDQRRQSVVSLPGHGECLFSHCLITLQRSGETPVSLASITDPGKVLKMDMPTARPRDKGPRLLLEGCLVRGEGDLMWARANRPFSLEVRRSIAALSGSVLNFESSFDEQAALPSQQVLVDLHQFMSYLNGPLIRLGCERDPVGMIKVMCQSSESLFLPAANSARSLVQFESTDSDLRVALADRFSWLGSRNAYGVYSTLLSLENVDGMAGTMGMGMGLEKWKQLTSQEKSIDGVKLLRGPASPVRFAQLTPGQFTLPTNLNAFEKLLQLNRMPALNTATSP